MLRFLLSDIVLTLVLINAAAAYAVHLRRRKHVPKEKFDEFLNASKEKMYSHLPKWMTTNVPMWLAIPTMAFLLLLTPIGISWYVWYVVKEIDNYDPKQEESA